jgi:signal transduction histidine kinase
VLAALRTVMRLRWAAVAFALMQIVTYYRPHPEGYETLAFCLTGLFAAANAVAMFVHRQGRMSARSQAILAMAIDALFALGLVWIYTFDVNTAIFIVLYLLPMEAAMLLGPGAPFVVMALVVCIYTLREWWGHVRWDGYAGQEYPFLWMSISFRMGVALLIAAVASAMARSFAREREQIQLRLEAQSRQVEATERLAALKSSFTTAVSHELRTPLTSIIGFAQTLRRRLTLDGDERTMLDHLYTESQRMGRLVEQLTDVQRLSSGDFQIKVQSTSVRDLVDAAVRDLACERLVLGHDREIDGKRVLVDREYAERAVQNLLINALKYSDESVGVATLPADGDDGTAGVIIRVEDLGEGVPDRYKRRVLEAFERVDEQMGPSPGAGLGLTLARDIVASHGGSLWIEDNLDGDGRVVGTAACIWFPLDNAPA